MSTTRKLTAKQLEALLKLSNRSCSVWDFGATTVSVLRTEGLIVAADGVVRITDAGREALRAGWGK